MTGVTTSPAATGSEGAWGTRLLDLADVERAARRELPADVWDFLAGGSGSELTLAANRSFLEKICLVPRTMVGARDADPSTTLLGPAAMPVALAPMAYQGLVHPEGEAPLARAARDAGVPLIASMLSSMTVEEIAAVGAETWFQLYWLRDRALMTELLGRAEAAGCRAVVLTVDVPRMGRRLRDMRNSFVLPDTVTAGNLAGAEGSTTAHRTASGSSAVMVHTAEAFDPALSWEHLDWIRERTRLPLVLKGVLDPADAARAAAAGVDALVVSNHGGRQLDGAVPSALALPGVVEAVAGRCPVLMDSGIRHGTDVLRALALGAAGVLLGRPALWGLAVDGERGAAGVLGILREELRTAMLLAGCPDVAATGRLTVAMPGDTRLIGRRTTEEEQ